MTEPNWTPGPWAVDDMGAAQQPVIRSDDGLCVASVGNAEPWSKAKHRWLADAHLIASAPTLFEALEAFVEFAGSEIIEEGCRGKSDPGCPSCMAIKVVDRARSALAKARGEA